MAGYAPVPAKSASIMRVGLLGAGTVGGGVVEILRKRGAVLAGQGADLQITTICVRDPAKKRDFELPPGCKVVTDPQQVVSDPNIEMVVELMGGVTVAKDAVMNALTNGKHVVTGNKALIAAFLPEIQALVKAKPGVVFAYEPAVCGGIPIIQTIKHDYVGDKITGIAGIMNGTTNFILSKMQAEGADYATVLAEAQKLGYAETPPDFDVEGWDARSKLAILCKLAFGVFVPEDKIPCYGITRVSAIDFQYAETLKATVKILGVGTLNSDGSVSAHVSTCIVPYTNQHARISGVTNCVAVTSENLGTCFYSGPGAGRFPTANSVINDMVAIAKGAGRGDPFPLNSEARLESETHGRFYIRFIIKDGLGIIREVGRLAEESSISINAILQLPIEDVNSVPFVLTTDATTRSAVTNFCTAFQKLPFCLESPLVMPILI